MKLSTISIPPYWKIHRFLESQQSSLFPSARLMILILGFFGVLNLSIAFSVMGFAMVCMVERKSPFVNVSMKIPEGCSLYGSVPEANQINRTVNVDFKWTDSEQSNIMAAFGWGSLWLLLPAGWIADRYGPRLIFAGSSFVSALTFIFFPYAARLGPWYAFILRFITGMSSSVQFPCFVALCTRWAPLNEMGTFLGIGTMGYSIGSLLSMLVSGLACSTIGWPYIFRIFGCFMLLWCVLWLILYRDEPEGIILIQQKEIDHIKLSRAVREVTHRPPPWSSILSSSAAISAFIAQFSFSWVVYFTAMYLPAYQAQVLLVDIRSNGFFATLLYVSQTLGRCLMGPLSDKITCLTRTLSVKVFNSICLSIPTLVFLTLTIIDCHERALAVFLFSLAQFAVSAQIGGYQKSYMFIAPNYAGTLSAIGQIVGFGSAAILPYAVGALNTSVNGWSGAFYCSSAVSLFGLLVFLLFGEGVEQDWAKDDEMEKIPLSPAGNKNKTDGHFSFSKASRPSSDLTKQSSTTAKIHTTQTNKLDVVLKKSPTCGGDFV